MKLTIELTTYKPKLDDEGNVQWWDVAFTITTADGINYFVPTTVYPNELRGTKDKHAVIRSAAMKMLPGQLAMALTETDDGNGEHANRHESSDSRREEGS